MKKTKSFLVAICLAVATASSTYAQAPDPIKSAKELLTPSANPVVNVGAIVQVDMDMMGSQDNEVKTVGMVVDPSGLTVVSRSALNPHGYEPRTVEVGPGMEMTIETEMTSVWLQLADGKRIDAEVVLTDPDLDLSFLRPIKPEDAKKLGLTPAQLKASADTASLLDTTIVLSRLGKDAGWAPAVRLERIAAVLETPWRSYAINAKPGETVFTAAGRVLGIVVVLPPSDGSKSQGSPMGGGAPMMAGGSTVVLPVSQFRGLIDQAKSKPSGEGKRMPKSKGAAKSKETVERISGATVGGSSAASNPLKGMLDKMIKPGTDAPTFSLLDEDGKQHSLGDYRGKYVLLDWWGIW